jgi:hypothetical protein
MDFKFIFIILFIGHLLGDFYFQSQSMVGKKDEEWKVMLCHGLIYMAFIIASFLLTLTGPLAKLSLILIIPILHIIVDIAKGWMSRKTIFESRQGILFVADQVIHVFAIASVACFYAIYTPVAYSWIGIHIGKVYAILNLELSAYEFIRLACLFLFLGKPVNIFIVNILKAVDTKDGTDSNTDPKAGWAIGILERYLTVILIILGQYTAVAVGLAFTAKTLTRFDKISKDKVFAEQYLIGTMSSLLFAVIGAVLYL